MLNLLDMLGLISAYYGLFFHYFPLDCPPPILCYGANIFKGQEKEGKGEVFILLEKPIC